MMVNALVTGGAGFIGSSLVDALVARGDAVTALDNFDPFYRAAAKRANVGGALERGAKLVEGDVTSEADVERAFGERRPDVVFHIAALAGVRPSIAQPAAYAHVNVVGTQRVIDACVAHGVGKLIVASSSSVYGNNRKAPFAEDDDVSHPISPYAATKVATELICGTAARLHHGLAIRCLRFFTVFGPRQRPDLAIRLFMSQIALGEPIRMFGDGSSSRDYTFIDDVIDGVLRAADRCGDVAPFRIYNLGSDHPVSLRELIESIEQTTGRIARVEAAAPQPGDVERTWADLSRSRAELGYAPRTSLRDGLAREWEWLRANG